MKTFALFCLFSIGVFGVEIRAQAGPLEAEIEKFSLDGLIRSAIGVTRKDTPIPCFLSPEDTDLETGTVRILLIGGLDGKSGSVQKVLGAAEWFQKQTAAKKFFAVSCVPCPFPDRLDANRDGSPEFPPTGDAYNQPENDEAHYLWRWIGMHAPDQVWVISESTPAAATLAEALSKQPPAETGLIPCDLKDPTQLKGDWFQESLIRSRNARPSPARIELQARVARSPVEIAQQLGQVYGRKLDAIAYIPSLAVIGRMRTGELTGDPQPLRDAIALAEPYRSGARSTFGEKMNASQMPGHLVFTALARATGDAAWTEIARRAADLGFDENGQPKESMPMHSEMSDSVFMGCPILAEVGALTGDTRYFDQCVRHLRFMQKLCRRDDDIYRHSPLDEAAWGRGNGFPALAMALSLSALPEDSQQHAECLQACRAQLAALRKHQDPTGMWRQVIDREESYREFTCTCMITFAIVRGIRSGWLDESEWTPVAEKAWTALKARIAPDGRLVDVCTGTGKQKNLRAYYDRTAILGPDDRGGAMALMVATEIEFWRKGK